MFGLSQKGLEDSYTQMTGDSFQFYRPCTNPTASGFGSLTVNQGWYKIVGGIIYFGLRVQGTSNSTSFTFDLPFTNIGNYGSNESRINIAGFVINNTVNTALGRIQILGGSKTVTCYSTQASGGFVTSGTKGVILTGFLYNNGI